MRLTENPGRIEAWVYRHASWLVALLIVIIIPLSAVTGWLVIDEWQQGKKLRGVDIAGPCRAFGIQNDECQKQARRIFAACYVQQEECWDKYGLPRSKAPTPERGAPKYGGSQGGDALHPGSTGHQQPGPRGGGQQGGGNGAGGKGGSGQGQPSTSPAPDQSPPSPAPSSTGSSAGAPPPAPAPGPPVGPQPKGPVEQAGDTVRGTVEGVKETADTVTSEVGKAAQGAVCGSLAAPGCSK